VLGKDVHTLGSSGPQKNIQRHTLGMKGVHAPSHYRSDDVVQAHWLKQCVLYEAKLGHLLVIRGEGV